MSETNSDIGTNHFIFRGCWRLGIGGGNFFLERNVLSPVRPKKDILISYYPPFSLYAFVNWKFWIANDPRPSDENRFIHYGCIFNIAICIITYSFEAPSRLWSYSSWIYNYLCNQCPSPLKLWVWIPLMARCVRYSIVW